MSQLHSSFHRLQLHLSRSNIPIEHTTLFVCGDFNAIKGEEAYLFTATGEIAANYEQPMLHENAYVELQQSTGLFWFLFFWKKKERRIKKEKIEKKEIE